MSAKKPFGLITGERFSGTITRLSTSTAIPFDIIQYAVPAAFPEPNASFTIQLMEGHTDLVAPYCGVFRATGFTGFNVAEPVGDTNVYDPTQHRITCIWDFGDSGYTPVLTPNLPTAWRNLNVAYGKQVAHVWHTSGTKTITCFAFDTAGNWGTATYTFGAGGQSPAIQSADSYYSGSNTIVWSQSSNWTGEPAGATRCTTIAEVHTALRSLITGGGNNRTYRILLRAGETFTNTFFFNISGSGAGYPGGTTFDYSPLRGLVWGSFGSGARPIVQIKRNSFSPRIFRVGGSSANRQWIWSDIVFRGGWDAATETGFDSEFTTLDTSTGPFLFTRCKLEGLSDFPGTNTLDSLRYLVFHDTEITNWSNYGMFIDTAKCAILGCDLHQKSDALTGIDHGGNRQEPWTLGNRHGPYRSATRLYDFIASCTSFYSRNGWSNSDGNWTTQPPTAEQPAIRHQWHFSSTGSNARRHHQVFDRCSFEGGWVAVAGFGPVQSDSAGAQVEVNCKNLLIDKCLFLGTAAGPGVMCFVQLTGVTIRNCYFYKSAVNPAVPGGAAHEIEFRFVSNGTLSGCGPIEVYNNTFINERSAGFSGSTAYTPIRIASGYNPLGNTITNNVIRIVNRSGFEGAAFLPLGTAALSGVTPRFAGLRWNYPPISTVLSTSGNTYTPVSRREQPGSPGVLQPGDVANLEWVFLPYPNWLNLCNNRFATFNATGAVTQALIQANSTQKHVVSLSNVDPKKMGDSALWDDADGLVAFDFISTGIRVQNRTGAAWTSASGDITVLLDMSDYLMPMATASASPSTVPISDPLAGSSALGTASGLIAQFDGTGDTRPGKLLSTGAFVSGTASQGWIEP